MKVSPGAEALIEAQTAVRPSPALHVIRALLALRASHRRAEGFLCVLSRLFASLSLG
jgi:hypothetical protein